MSKIRITCNMCGDSYEVHRTSEIPDEVTALKCNWCPICDDKGLADCDYEEEYCYSPILEPIDPNQIKLDL